MRSYDTFNPTIPETDLTHVNQTYPPLDEEIKQSETKRRRKSSNSESTSRRKKAKSVEASNIYEKVVQFATSQTTRWLFGLLLGFLGVYLAICFVSYFGSCISDQSEIYNTEIGAAGEISNAGGEGGARLSEFLINGCFGLGSFVIVIWLVGMSLKQLVGRPRFKSVNFTIKCLVALITVSLIIGLLTIGLNASVNWGGYHGRYINEAVIHFLGWAGAVILCLFMVACFFVICLRDVINWVIKLRNQRLERKRIEDELRQQELAKEQAIEEMRRYEDAEGMPIQTDEIRATVPQEQNVVFNPQENGDNNYLDLDTAEYTYVLEGDNEEIESKEIEEPVETYSEYNPEEESVFHLQSGEIFEDKDKILDDKTVEIEAIPKDNVGESEITDNEPAMIVNANEIEMSEGKRPEMDHTPMSRHPYNFPPYELLREGQTFVPIDADEQIENKEKIRNTLLDFDIPITSIEATVGPTVTLYKIVPDKGVKVAKIRSLVDDIALSLSAEGVRIIAPIPGEGAVGIEVANKSPQVVSMRTVIKSKKFKESQYKLPIAIGSTISNEVYITDLAKMPHLLVAGATGQGKSVGLNAIITSLLYSKSPDELKFVMVDPKMVEFNLYAKIESHYLAKLPDAEEPIITDMDKVVATLNSLCIEMDNRYMLLKDAHTRNIVEYNDKIKEGSLDPRTGHRFLPYIVVIVDEFSDLIMTAGKEVEMPIARLAQKARAVGMHVIIATQRPSTNVITGIIKANFPARMAFKVSSGVDSKTILDTPGAQQLIGRGDMLISNSSPMVRVQCAFIDTPEVEAICDYIARQPYAQGAYELPEPVVANDGEASSNAGLSGDKDPYFAEAARHVVSSGHASTSNLQRIYSIGYNRAGKIMDQMEAVGIVGPAQGGKTRSVLVDPATLENILATL